MYKFKDIDVLSSRLKVYRQDALNYTQDQLADSFKAKGYTVCSKMISQLETKSKKFTSKIIHKSGKEVSWRDALDDVCGTEWKANPYKKNYNRTVENSHVDQVNNSRDVSDSRKTTRNITYATTRDSIFISLRDFEIKEKNSMKEAFKKNGISIRFDSERKLWILPFSTKNLEITKHVLDTSFPGPGRVKNISEKLLTNKPDAYTLEL